MNQDLKNAIDRVNAALDAIEAWEAFKEACRLLALIVPGFVCPFTGEPGIPTLEEMQAYAQQWDAQYCQGAGGG
jgi:hypothetical protein